MPVPPLEGTGLGKAATLAGEVETMSEQNESALKGEELHRQIGKLEGWTLADEKRLEKEYRFPDFKEALAYVNRLGEAAERAGHHPDIFFTWGKVKVTLWTHSAGGVTAKDVALAAEADAVR
jgi:4a-hydroxytetrahydrobiopterin dehydratase